MTNITPEEIRDVQKQVINAKKEADIPTILGANPNPIPTLKINPHFYQQNHLGYDHTYSRFAATITDNPTTERAGPNTPRQILTRSQLMECMDSYTNDGIMRRCVNTLKMGIKGKRIKFVAEPNTELSEFLEEEELRLLNDQITKNDRVPELRRKQIRIDKRCKFNERMDTFLTSFFVLGRGLSGIVRYPRTEEFPIYGEPKAIQPLNTIRITDIEVDPITYELKGVEYDFGLQEKKIIRPSQMIFGVNDDSNLYDNTAYSGISPVWTCLSASQSNLVINDEDIPEATRQLAHKFGILNVGTNNPNVVAQFRDQLQMSSWLVHGQQGVSAEVHDLARDLTELPRVREYTAKYMTWSMLVPLFLIFEDTANFATANQAVQAWKATVIDYYRTKLQDILEQYWYDYTIADHYGVKVEDVISMRVKIKPVFEDLIFDTYKDNVDAVVALTNASIYTDEDALQKLGEDRILQAHRQLNAVIMDQREQDIKQREEELNKQENAINQNNQAQNQNQTNQAAQQSNNQRFNNNRK